MCDIFVVGKSFSSRAENRTDESKTKASFRENNALTKKLRPYNIYIYFMINNARTINTKNKTKSYVYVKLNKVS